MHRRQLVIYGLLLTAIAVFTTHSLTQAQQPNTPPKPSPSQKAEVHSVVEPTPELTPTPTVAKNAPVEKTWRDNPNQCDVSRQWIAAEAPFSCIDKPQPAPTIQPTTNVASSQPVAPQNVTPAGSHQDWLSAAGIPSNVWSCADTLIQRESGWRVNAQNPTSPAYGIPQALPGEKMASHGADWCTNPVTQLRWMHDYVNTRYGGFCQALQHSYAKNWY
jgi:hypothetical protein